MLLNIKNSILNIEYKRSVEGMGKGLVLLKICARNKRIGQNYHLYYENGKKPPLDVAINPENNLIEYVSFFLQDEEIRIGKLESHISFVESNIEITNPAFTEKNVDICEHKEFDILIEKDFILVIDKSISDNVIAYRLNESNYILVDRKKQIVGTILKNITKLELGELKNSAVI